jgi:hypothetical protein
MRLSVKKIEQIVMNQRVDIVYDERYKSKSRIDQLLFEKKQTNDEVHTMTKLSNESKEKLNTKKHKYKKAMTTWNLNDNTIHKSMTCNELIRKYTRSYYNIYMASFRQTLTGSNPQQCTVTTCRRVVSVNDCEKQLT